MPNASFQPERVLAPLPLIKRYRYWLIALATLLLIYALLGFLLVPRLIKQYAPQYVHEHLHRQLTLGEVQFNPFTFTVQIGKSQLDEQNGTPIFGFAHLLVNAELSSVFTGHYSFKRMQLDSPSVHAIVSADGKLNLDFSDTQAPQENSKQPLPVVRIGELQLKNGLLHLEDRARPTPFSTELRPIEFTLSEFSTKPNDDSAFHFAAASAAGETLDFHGELTMQPLGSKGQFKVTGLQASTLQGYLQDALPFRLLSGSLALQGDYQLAANDSLDLNLNLPTIAVSNAQVAPLTDANAPWITLPQLALSNTHVSLRERNINIRQVKLSDAQITAWLDAEHQLNLLQLLGPDKPNDAPWTTHVESIVAENAAVQMEDRSITPAGAFKFSPAQLEVKNFSTAPGASIQLATTLRVNDQGDVHAEGSIDLDTLSSQLNIKVASFPLSTMQNYAAQITDLIISNGQLNAQGNVYYKGTAKNNQPELKFDGDVDIADLSTQDKLENKDFIKWQSLQLQHMSYSMAPNALEIAQITAHQPYGRVIIDSDTSTNIQHVLRMKPATEHDETKTKANKASAPTMRTRIAKVMVDNGSADFADYSVQPTFATGMERLNGVVSNLSSANDSRAKVDLKGSVDNYAPVTISGEANFLAADTFSDIAMNFRNMELTTFNPYSGKFAGYSIAKGKLNTELRYQIQNRELNAQHHLVIDQLEFGPATDSKDAVPLPIKLAASLLKDRNGVIDLNLPVTGSLDDPEFKIRPVVWKAFVGLLTKIVTAPFSALGSLFGGGGDELAYVDFTPGAATLSATEIAKLNKLAKAMVERPQLKLNIPLTAVTDSDAAALNDAVYAQALNGVLPNAASATASQRLSALTTLYKNKTGNAPTFPATDAKDATADRIAYLETQLKALFAISAADRDALTRARADAVQAALLTNPELAPERIYLTVRSNKIESPAGVARMELQLE